MRKLTAAETQNRIEEIGIARHARDAFAFLDQTEDVAYDWHSHDNDQLLYAISGTLQVETAEARYLLPPQRALWIPADTHHRTWLHNVRAATVFFPAPLMDRAFSTVRVLAAPPLMREMILYATRWPPGHNDPGELAQNYFRTLSLLCREWLLDEMPFCLPRCDHPALVRALDYVQANLATATIKGACAAAAMSERTLRRHFQDAMGIGWQEYLSHSRMMRALALLSSSTPSIAEVAEEVGFSNLGSFSRSFREFSGEKPSRFRARIGVDP